MAVKKSKIPTPTTTNDFNGRKGHVSLAREEYEALASREEAVIGLTTENAKLRSQAIEMATTLDAQAKHLSTYDLKVAALERVDALQSALIAAFKDKEKTLGLTELSEFWRQWTVAVSNAADTRKLEREEILKFEPDLFRMWRNWVNDSGKTTRTLSFAGSRGEIEAAAPRTQVLMQTHLLARKNEENAKLQTRIAQLEAELGALVPTP